MSGCHEVISCNTHVSNFHAAALYSILVCLCGVWADDRCCVIYILIFSPSGSHFGVEL